MTERIPNEGDHLNIDERNLNILSDMECNLTYLRVWDPERISEEPCFVVCISKRLYNSVSLQHVHFSQSLVLRGEYEKLLNLVLVIVNLKKCSVWFGNLRLVTGI